MFQIRRSSKINSRGSSIADGNSIRNRESQSVERKSKIPLSGSVQRSKSHIPIQQTPSTSGSVVKQTPSRTPYTPISYSLQSVKDSRNLQQKESVATMAQQVKEYFQQYYPDVLVNGVDIKPVTANAFVRMVNHLFDTLKVLYMGEPINLTRTNYVKTLPLCMKDLNYPTPIKSWIQTVNVPHAYPNVVALLSWLVTLVEFGNLIDFQTILGGNPNLGDNNQSGFVSLSLETYPLFVAGEEQQRGAHIIGFMSKVTSNGGLDEEETITSLMAERANLENVLESNTNTDIIDNYDEVVQRVNVVQAQYAKTIEDMEKIEKEIADAKESIVKAQKKILLVENEIEAKLGEVQVIKKALSAQTMSVGEQTDIQKKCEFQQKQNKLLEKEIEDYHSMMSKNEMTLSDMKDKVLQARHCFNRSVIQLKPKIPELTMLNRDKDHAPEQALEESKQMSTFLNELKSDYKNKHQKLEVSWMDVLRLTENKKKDMSKVAEQEQGLVKKLSDVKLEIEVLETQIKEMQMSEQMESEQLVEKEEEINKHIVLHQKLKDEEAAVAVDVENHVKALEQGKKMAEDFLVKMGEMVVNELKQIAKFDEQRRAMDEAFYEKYKKVMKDANI